MYSVECLSSRVAVVCNAAVYGGRCSVVDNTRCVLYDCSNWTSAMSVCILEEFPTCCITVTSVDTSVSGFAVVFVLQERTNRLHTTFFVFLLVAVLSIVSVYVYHMVSHVVPFFPISAQGWVESALRFPLLAWWHAPG